MTQGKLQKALTGRSVTDVIITGFIDPDEKPLRFYALYRIGYIVCDGTTVKLSVIGYTGRMRITLTDQTSCDAELDDDLLPALSSIQDAVLRDPDGRNRLVALQLWSPGDTPSGVECAAARFDLENGQELFVDPSYHFGIRIGGAEQQRIWQENSAEGHVHPVSLVCAE